MIVSKKLIRGAAWCVLLCQAIGAYFAVPWVRADAPDYLRLSADLARGSFGTADWPEALRPPGYPLFLCALHDILGLPLGAIVAIQLGMCLLSVWLIARFLKGPLATTFLCLAAIYPFTALYASAIMAEGISILLLTTIAVVVVNGTSKHLFIAGALSGLLAMFRPDFALLPLAIAAGVIFKTPVRALAPIVAAVIVMTPYALWNETTFGRLSPLPVAGAVGSSLYLSTWQDKLPLKDINALYDHVATPEARRVGLAADVERLNRKIGAPPLTAPWNAAEYQSLAQQRASVGVLKDAAIQRIEAEPGFYARHVVLNVWRLWNSSSYPALSGLLSAISAIVTILGLVGALLTFWSPRSPLTRAQVLIFAYLPAIHVWLHTEARYTAAARPMLLMFAAALMVRLVASRGSFNFSQIATRPDITKKEA